MLASALPEWLAGAQVGARDHPLDLAAQQRDLARIAVVGGGREQAEEAVLAEHPALGVEPPHADVVEIDRAVHGRAAVGLGDHQRHRQARQAAHLRRQRCEAARVRARARLGLAAQQAHRRALDAAQLVAVLLAQEVVAGVAEEGEVVVGDPAQEGLDLGDLLGVERLGAALADPRAPARSCPSMPRQSSTAARTSAMTRSRLARIASRRAGSLSWSISKCMNDSEIAWSRGRPGASTASSMPPASRRTGITGWIVRWIRRPWPFSAMLAESTRNGMSSVTTSTTVWVDCQPCCSICGL